MHGMFLPRKDRDFADHPKFTGVRIAILVRGVDSDHVSVSQLEIASGVEVPIHTHAHQLDSIFVLSGHGEVFINGNWQQIEAEDYLLAPAGVEHAVRNTGQETLRLFVHHSPPLL